VTNIQPLSPITHFCPLSGRVGRWLLLSALFAALTGCGGFGLFESGDSAPRGGIDVSRIQNAVPRVEPRSRSGNPSSYRVNGHTYHVMQNSYGYVERGIASWYGTKFHGRRTSSGEPYDMYAMTAAHRVLPLPTYAQVTNLRNGRSVVVRVNDRGPFHENRIIDLSYAAAAKLGILGTGTGLVEVRAIDPGRPAPPPPRFASYENDPIMYVQVGAFASRDNAERLRARLQGSIPQRIRIQTAYAGGIPLFRVQVGPLANVDQADAVSLQLARMGIQEMQVVIE
jgi:rare lipoprotein A